MSSAKWRQFCLDLNVSMVIYSVCDTSSISCAFHWRWDNGLLTKILWLCTSNSFENGDFWQTCPHSLRQNGYFWIVRFLATGIILKRSSWATTYGKWSAFYRLNFWQYWFTFIKANFRWFVFHQTPSDAPSHHLKASLLWENIVPRDRTNCAI